MALEFVEITAGSGTKVAVDRVTVGADTVEVQVVKLGLGADGTVPTLVAFGQAAMAASVPVVVASDQSAIPLVGTKTGNAAAPGATNVGALAAVANAAEPTWTEGYLVPLSVDLTGVLRVQQGHLTAANDIVDLGGTAATALAGVKTGTDHLAAMDTALAGVKTGTDHLAQIDTNIGTLAANTALTDGTQKAIPRGAAKGATTAGDVTSTNVSVDRQALDAVIYNDAAAGVYVRQGTSAVWTVVQPTATSLNATVTQGGAGGTAWLVSLPAASLGAGNLVQVDYDTAAGTQNMPMVGLALPGSGGAVAGGTAANPIKVDASGTPVPVTNIGTFAVQAAQSVAANLKSEVVGVRTTNTAVPGATNVGVLPAVVAASAPTLTDTFLAALSVDTAGGLRVASHPVTNAGTFAVQAAQATAANLKTEAVGTRTTNSAAPGATNVGVLGAVANAAAPTLTETFLTALSVDLAGGLRVASHPVTNAGTFAVQAAGTKTNNNAAPGATNVGTLSAVANAAAPSWTEGNQVALSTTLAGSLRTTGGVQYTEGDTDALITGTAIVFESNTTTSAVAVVSDTTPLPVQQAHLTAANDIVDLGGTAATTLSGVKTGTDHLAAMDTALGGVKTGTDHLAAIDTNIATLAADTALTDGTQKAIARGGAKGATTAADITSTAQGVDHQALDVTVLGTVPLPTGAATAAKQPALGTAGTASSDVITVQGIAAMTPILVDGSGVTQPVSAASLPLPSGAATAAKQPALGTAGTASADVITVQGVASMTALTVAQATASNLKAEVTNAGTFAVQATGVAGEAHLGTVGSPDTVVDLTASLDTAIYADGDVLFDTQELASAARVNAGTLILETLTVLDEDDQGQAFKLVFLDANNSLGTENGAPNISDANARAILGIVPVASTDYVDLGGSRVATLRNLGLQMKAGAGTTSLYVGAISGGTGTYTASGIRLKCGFLRN